MNKLETQTKYFNVVVNFVTTDKDYIDKINNMVGILISTNYGGQYAYCTHWYDTHDNGELKHIHTHFVIELPKRVRLITLLNVIADYTNLDLQYISIDSTRSINASIQYLIHKNDLNKYQYDSKCIISNYSPSDLDYYLNSNSICIDFDSLCKIIVDSNGDLSYIIKTIGVSRYNMYRKVIIDLYVTIFQHAPYTIK